MFYVFSKSPVVESGKKLIIEKKLTGTTFPQLLSVIHEKYKKRPAQEYTISLFLETCLLQFSPRFNYYIDSRNIISAQSSRSAYICSQLSITLLCLFFSFPMSR